jgi:two-component system chemotaxis response regulator CheB
MPGGFTKSLADRLNELSQITVKEAEDGDILSKGTVYIAKGGYQMRLKRQVDGQYCITISKEPARHGLLPCADIMYESLTDTNFDQITCVVLTGMGGDGTAGITQLSKKQNIYVIAQNEETSIVYGMPKVIKEAGLVDEVVALSDVSGAIAKNVGVH